MPAPDFRIKADGRPDATEAIRRRLLSLTVSDRAGWESDTCRIRIDDEGGSVELVEMPRRGVTLAVSMGYADGLAPMGRFVVDEVVASGAPAELSVVARAADFRETLKAPRTRSWDETTLGAVVSKIAGEHGLRPAVAASLRPVPVLHLDQTSESDLAFLARVSEDRGAELKVSEGSVIVAPPRGAQSASGLTIAPVRILLTAVTRYRAVLADRPRYGAVTATWHSTAEARRRVERAGEGSPAYQLPYSYATREEAATAARAKLEALQRLTATLRLEMPGDPRILSGTPLELDGFRGGIPDNWTAMRVDQVIDRRGYVTRVDAEQASRLEV